jgi:hypothetical protein
MPINTTLEPVRNTMFQIMGGRETEVRYSAKETFFTLLVIVQDNFWTPYRFLFIAYRGESDQHVKINTPLHRLRMEVQHVSLPHMPS